MADREHALRQLADDLRAFAVLDALIACVAIVVLLIVVGMILLIPFIFFAMSNSSPYRRCMASDDAGFVDAYLCLLHG